MKRYDPYVYDDGTEASLSESPKGEWVRFADVEPLIAALRELNELVVFSNQKRIIDSALAKLGEK